jgi:hypothetical protein
MPAERLEADGVVLSERVLSDNSVALIRAIALMRGLANLTAVAIS